MSTDDGGPDDPDASPPTDAGGGECADADEGDACGDPEDGTICIAGECVTSTCGDGFVNRDDGEQCDDGNDDNDDGCTNDCLLPCSEDADCDDGLICNGEETCNTDRGFCSFGVNASDGTSCPDGECVFGACESVECGNSIVNTGEQCDDGNAMNGDGCEDDCTFSCDDGLDCDDGDACTVDLCDPETRTCSSMALDCDDGLECTTDSCVADTGCVNELMDGDMDGFAPMSLACDDRGGDCDDGDDARSPTQTETCDATDNDCDGTAGLDQVGICDCTPGETRPCYTGPSGTRGRGACMDGQELCMAGGTWSGSCLEDVTPATEICGDDIDSDCDGFRDTFIADGCVGDLVLTDFVGDSQADERILVGGNVSWSFDLENAGDGRTDPFEVLVEAERSTRTCNSIGCTASTEWVELDRISFPDGVGAGETILNTATDFVGPAFVLQFGTPLRARAVRPGTEITGPRYDANFDNNEQTSSIVGRTGPDYEVTMVRPAAGHVEEAGDRLRIEFRIANVGGSQPATNHPWAALLEQTGGGSTILASEEIARLIPVGEEVVVTGFPPLPADLTPDFYRFIAVAEPFCGGSTFPPCVDTDRENNSDEVVFEVIAP